MMQSSLAEYMGIGIKPFVKPEIISKPIVEEVKARSILDKHIPIDEKYWKRILRTRPHLINCAIKDRKKFGIGFGVVSQPMGIGKEWDCDRCRNYYNCREIAYLTWIAQIKEDFPKRRKNNRNGDFLCRIWDYLRIRQRNCAWRKLSFIRKKKREAEKYGEYVEEFY